MDLVKDATLPSKIPIGPLPPFDPPAPSRSRNMAAIRSKNTKPEMVVRSGLHRSGYRFRLHADGGNRRADILLARFKIGVFVHGCFWHGHPCRRGHVSKTNTQYWSTKISRNKLRDTRNIKDLESQGWRVILIWECQLDNGLKNLLELLEEIKANQV